MSMFFLFFPDVGFFTFLRNWNPTAAMRTPPIPGYISFSRTPPELYGITRSKETGGKHLKRGEAGCKGVHLHDGCQATLLPERKAQAFVEFPHEVHAVFSSMTSVHLAVAGC